MTSSKTQPRDYTSGFNRVLYCTNVLLGIYFLIFKHDISSAMSTLGIGLIFDPFNHELSWNQRPVYQKIILISHVTLVFVLLGILLVRALNS